MKEIVYETQGTCSKAIRIVLDDEQKIEEVEFFGGCDGNTKGISTLVRGMKAEDVIKKRRGMRCGYKATSCPDQLAQALEKM